MKPRPNPEKAPEVTNSTKFFKQKLIMPEAPTFILRSESLEQLLEEGLRNERQQATALATSVKEKITSSAPTKAPSSPSSPHIQFSNNPSKTLVESFDKRSNRCVHPYDQFTNHFKFM